jgi:hypothetical protein
MKGKKETNIIKYKITLLDHLKHVGLDLPLCRKLKGSIEIPVLGIDVYFPLLFL